MGIERLCMGCMEEKNITNICSLCGYDESNPISPIILAPRTLLMNGHYLIGKVLGKPGGFGITYLAWDAILETKVAIKEFLPRDLAGRDTNHKTVVPHHNDDKEIFEYGLDRFVQEGRTLAKFDHPNVVRVRTFFEENGTAYLVMNYYDGVSLEQYLKDKGGRIAENLAIDIMMPIMDGLREVHQRGFLHRDIKPQNIYLTTGGIPILLDFGAARFAMGERTRSLSVVLSPGYAPFEQYHKKGNQGPWTDIYSTAATLYKMVTGEGPAEAPDRVIEDELQPVDKLIPHLSARLSKALTLALSTKPEGRPQTVKKFQELLFDNKKKVTEISSQNVDSDDLVFDFAKKLGTQKAMELYLEQFPGGIHAAEAEEILKPIREKDKKTDKKKPKKYGKQKQQEQDKKKELEYTGEQKQIIINLEQELEKPVEQIDTQENQNEEEELIIEYKPPSIRI